MGIYNRKASFDVTVRIDEDEVRDYVKKNFYPEDVFDKEQLETWARENGWEEAY